MSTLYKQSRGAVSFCVAHSTQNPSIISVTLGTPYILENEDAAK
jgi:hypothetical protein